MDSFKSWILIMFLISGSVHGATLPPLPVARDDSFLLNSLVLNVSAPGLLANDSGTELLVSSFFNPSAGTLDRVVTDGTFQYTAPRGFDSVASFVYSNMDELGRSASATVYIDYGASIPVAFEDSFSVLAGQTLDISAPGLLANDVGGIGSLIVSGFFNPAQGVLESVITDGSFRYRAPVGFSGVDTFSYSALDELGRSSLATVSIQVTAVPEPSQALLLLTGLALFASCARRRWVESVENQ